MTQSLCYPDNGRQLEDRAILRNAIVFTTAQRAFTAERLRREPLDQLDRYVRAFLAVDAFTQFVLSLEDGLGWFFVLRDWQPGTVEGGLFALLDKVQVGRKIGKNDWTEDAALELVESLDPDSYRRLVHLPSTQELLDAGWSPEETDAIEKAMEHQLEGFQTLIERRADKKRAYVRAYNKSKHMLLGILNERRHGKLEVGLFTSTIGYNDPRGIDLGGAILECEPEDILRNATFAIQVQAVLNAILTLILWTRYGERIESQQWVRDIYSSPGWRVSNPP